MLDCGKESILRLMLLFACFALVAGFGRTQERSRTGTRPPSFIIIFTDDQGYGDTGSFGARGFATPNLDRMAAQGVRFTSFYVPQAVCSSSRAALLTGCYPNRVGVVGALGPNATHGLHPRETTIPELLKPLGYATAMYGKWHLGHHRPFLPVHHGFDDYLGLPYSNDMWPPNNPGYPPLPLIEGDKVIHPNVAADIQKQLTTWYTERAVKFIDQHADRPFFLYLAHAQPHVPLFVSDKFAGKSEKGIYGDVLMEIDWSVGQVLDALKRNNLDEHTLVIFTTDNGPWLVYGDHGGSAGPLREGKATAWEGGMRVPAILRWPGKIPAGSECREPAMTIDLLPTIASLAGASLPTRPIDGKNIWPLIVGEPGAASPHEAYYFYMGYQLHAIRSGKWKLHVPHTYNTIVQPGSAGQRGRPEPRQTGTELYDLESDIGEKTDLADKHPGTVERLMQYVNRARADLGDDITKTPGTGRREPGRIEDLQR